MNLRPYCLMAQLSNQRQLDVCLVAFMLLVGCARTDYRREADSQSYCLIQSRESDVRWELPDRVVEPKLHSRMYMAAEDDCGPKPEDDPAANCYMQSLNCIDNSCYYSKIPNKGHTENPIWVDYLPRDENDKIKLGQPLAIDLALLHSREYQTEFEEVYLNALALSENRFEFDSQWFGGIGATYTAPGADSGDEKSLAASLGRLGFTRNLAGGGQFATNILNSLAWDFGTGGIQAGSAELVTTFTQPLLRGAFRHVRLEDLTQAERNLLYSVRNFARFRRTFYVDIVTSYLNLLTQVQALRNLQTNVDNLKQNLVEHEFYVRLEVVSQIQRDQVFQQYQNGRLSLLASEQNLTASLDAFKFQLGLPPWVPLEIDESLLDAFELVDPTIVELQDEAQELYETLVQYLPPEKAPKELLVEKFEKYEGLRERVAETVPNIDEELDRWVSRLESTDESKLGTDDRLDLQQQSELVDRIQGTLSELKATLAKRETGIEKLKSQIERYDAPATEKEDSLPSDASADSAEVGIEPEILAWEALMQAVGEQLREEISELYVAQTQIRLFLIDIEPLTINEQTAITYAHMNRLDVMNSKASVMDAFRKV